MQPERDFTAEQVVSVVRRRGPLVVLCVVLVAAIAFAFSKHEKPIYTATASILFKSGAVAQQLAGLPASQPGNQQSQQDTNVQLVQLGDMASATARALDHGLTTTAVKRSLTVSPVGDTSVVNVSAKSASPKLAAQIANTYSTQFVNEQQTSNQTYYASALALITKQLAQLSPAQQRSSAGLDLQARAQSLGTLSVLKSDAVQVAQQASVPSSPSSPRILRTTVLAAFFGLLLGIAVAVVLERSDRVMRDPSDFATAYGLPLLGVVPESAELSRSMRRSDTSRGVLPPVEAETFHLIHAHLRYFNIDRELRTVLVASAGAGDGKTTIACHLAGAAARLGARVLLLEADVRRPTISAQLQLGTGPGLSEVLIGAVRVEQAIQTARLDFTSTTTPAQRTIDVLPAGLAVPPNPAELLESQAMAALLGRAKESYDLVVIDTPPLTAVSDAFPLLRIVDGVIMVGRVDLDRRDVAERTREILSSVGAPLLGVIANGVKAPPRGYYGYSYSYTDMPGGGDREAGTGERDAEADSRSAPRAEV